MNTKADTARAYSTRPGTAECTGQSQACIAAHERTWFDCQRHKEEIPVLPKQRKLRGVRKYPWTGIPGCVFQKGDWRGYGYPVKDALAMSALYQAVGREHTEVGQTVHTDRGAQYTSHRFTALLQRNQFRQSMSRKGNTYDNAIMEFFYRTLKRELVQGADYDTPEQARLDVFKYIETYA